MGYNDSYSVQNSMYGTQMQQPGTFGAIGSGVASDYPSGAAGQSMGGYSQGSGNYSQGSSYPSAMVAGSPPMGGYSGNGGQTFATASEFGRPTGGGGGDVSRLRVKVRRLEATAFPAAKLAAIRVNKVAVTTRRRSTRHCVQALAEGENNNNNLNRTFQQNNTFQTNKNCKKNRTFQQNNTFQTNKNCKKINSKIFCSN